MPSLTTHAESETVAAGWALAQSLAHGAVVLLSGDLGAGKTAFVRGIAGGLGMNTANVTSPTFTLVQEYRGGRLPLIHVDLYRLHSSEVDDLGLEEMAIQGGVMAIEWPDRLPRPFRRAITVRISHGQGNTRTINIS